MCTANCKTLNKTEETSIGVTYFGDTQITFSKINKKILFAFNLIESFAGGKVLVGVFIVLL